VAQQMPNTELEIVPRAYHADAWFPYQWVGVPFVGAHEKLHVKSAQTKKLMLTHFSL
jgi:hypothetical protein